MRRKSTDNILGDCKALPKLGSPIFLWPLTSERPGPFRHLKSLLIQAGPAGEGGQSVVPQLPASMDGNVCC